MRVIAIMKIQCTIIIFFMTICSVRCYYEVIVEDGASAIATVEEHRRVKRAWSYPPVHIKESVAGLSFTRRQILTIKSDNPAAATYVLQPSEAVNNGIFSIDNANAQTTGANLYQEKPVDREELLPEDADGNVYYMIAAAALNSAGQRVEPEDVELQVIVDDINDNSPVFDQSSLRGQVPEDARIGTTFMRILATDADSSAPNAENNGVVSYRLDGNLESSFPFAINEYSGDITVVGQLDRETVPSIQFVVSALDGLRSLARHTVTATVTVQVSDANDHAPVFINEPYEVSVGELTPVETVAVETVFAEDEDVGNNSAVAFAIDSGNIGNHFMIRSHPNPKGRSYGTVYVKEPLDYENGPTTFYLNVVAKNPYSTNANAYKSSAIVTVKVLDENEPPIFINQPYQGFVRENQPGENVIATVQAVDLDFGGTQTVSYSLMDPLDAFTVSQDGVISTKAPVDRESYLVDQATNIYMLTVQAKDDDGASSSANVAITIGDANDNAPMKGTGWNAIICESPSKDMEANVTVITVIDKDSSENGPPFSISIVSGYKSPFGLELLSPVTGAIVQAPNFKASEIKKYEIPIQLIDAASEGQSKMTSTETATISVCSCDADYKPSCSTAEPTAAGFNFAILIAIIAAILIILIIILALVAYRRRMEADAEKQNLFIEGYDEREHLQVYHEEGGGEEDNDAYDISALQAPPLVDPKRQDVTPLTTAQPQPRVRAAPDANIEEYIDESKQLADNDPSAPPFDSLLVFDYEGQGSDAGTLSSLNSGTTDASVDYDYLKEWGPKFKKLSDMYGGGESDY